MKLTCILERRKKKEMRGREGKKNLGNRITATQGRKMIVSEIERAKMNS